MKKSFNTAGFCHPDRDYMVNPLRGLEKAIYELIEGNKYFLIHAPRQSGKTTLLHALTHQLNREGKYIALTVSVGTAGVPGFTEDMANERMIDAVQTSAQYFLPEALRPRSPKETESFTLETYLRAWCGSLDKPVVIFFDEADSLFDDVMVSFLRQLRESFQFRPKQFPASVALVGLRDIREYKLKAKGDRPGLGSGSPFNIKTESFMLKNFSYGEVTQLLSQHTQATGQAFPKEVTDRIFELSAGQPWLVNALAHHIVARLLENDHSKPITLDLVEQAKEDLIARRDTHLDSLVDKLKETSVRQVVTSIINGELTEIDHFNDALLYCQNLGIVALDAPIRFANPIYKEITTRLMNNEFHWRFDPDVVETRLFVHPDGSLNMEKLLRDFIKFYRRHSESWLERFQYKEAGHQLLLMAFLQRVVNGGGRIEREMAVGKGRTDIEVEWKNERFALELKLKHDQQTREDGLEQLWRYLDKLGLQHGYLILFEKKSSEEIPWEQRLKWEDETVDGKRITVVEM